MAAITLCVAFGKVAPDGRRAAAVYLDLYGQMADTETVSETPS
jgi:hypothetical protein